MIINYLFTSIGLFKCGFVYKKRIYLYKFSHYVLLCLVQRRNKENMVLNVSMGVTSFYKFFQNHIRPPSPVAPLAGALIGADNTQCLKAYDS